jgi:hypothetical protein
MPRSKNVNGKAIVVSISCSPEEKQFLELKGISPTQLFRKALKDLKLKLGKTNPQIEKDFEVLRRSYVQSTRPNGNIEVYWKLVNAFLEKYPVYTKVEVMSRVQRERFINFDNETGEI